MQINISEIIVEALFKHNKVNLPGVGSFEIKQEGAAFNPGKKSIRAPKSSIVFSEKHEESSEMVPLLMDRYSLSEKKALKVLNNFSNQVLNGFLNYDKVLIKNFGVLKRNSEGKVNFKASKFLDAWLMESLPDLEVQHITKDSKTKIVKEELPEKTNKATTSLAAKEEKANAPLEQDSIEKLKEIPKASEKTAVEKTQIREKVKTTPEKTLDEKKVVEPVNYDDYKEGRSWAWLIPLIFTLLIIGGIVWGIKWYNNNSYQSSKANSVDTTASSIDTTEHPEEMMLEETSEEQEGSKNGDAADKAVNSDAVANPEECIIVVGSYRNESNITDMIYQIREKGLTTYTEKYGPYIRVGFKFACTNVDLRSYIKEVRMELGDQSWYLVPNVEY